MDALIQWLVAHGVTLAADAPVEEVFAAALAKLEAGGADAQVAARVRGSLGLDGDAGQDAVLVALSQMQSDVGRFAQVEAELAAVRGGDADREAVALRQTFIDDNVINPNDQAQMTATLVLARENPEQLKQVMGAKAPYAPRHFTEPPSRRAVAIGEAVQTFRADPKLARQCDVGAYVDQALREQSMPTLGVGRTCDVPVTPGGVV